MYLSIDQGMLNIGLTVWNKNKELIYKDYLYNNFYNKERVNRIKQELEEIIREFSIEYVICEDLMIFQDNNFYGVKQAIKITGIIELLCIENNIIFLELPLKSIKKNAEKGNLNKQESCLLTGEENDHISDSILIFNYFEKYYLENEINNNF